MNDKIRVLLVDDNDDFAVLFKNIVAADERLDYLGHASDRRSGVEAACRMNPDIVVMDLDLSGEALEGIDAAKEIRVKTGTKILFLTVYDRYETVITASKKAFASGYIFKSHFQMITDAIYNTAASDTPQKDLIRELILSGLTSAERGVFDRIMKGDDDEAIHSSASTIANQKTSIFRKLGLKSTKELKTVFGNW